jgi:hypothetical protein
VEYSQETFGQAMRTCRDAGELYLYHIECVCVGRDLVAHKAELRVRLEIV